MGTMVTYRQWSDSDKGKATLMLANDGVLVDVLTLENKSTQSE